MSDAGSIPQRALAALVLLGVTACSAAEAAPDPRVEAHEPHPAVAIVDRLAGGHEHGVADLTGLEPGAVTARLHPAGLRAQVVAFGTGPVTAQYPEPGAAPPADGVVVVWTGTPPAPPPPPEPEPEPAAPATPAAEATPPVTAPAASAPAPAPTAPAPDPAPTGAPPPRTNPGRLPETAPGTVVEGLASWYGPGFAGRTTACGGTFDPDALTLATRELRCGTRVLVTGPSGASTEAVATDWGPAEWTGRRFDLSRATFVAVHPLGAGVARVTVEVLAP